MHLVGPVGQESKEQQNVEPLPIILDNKVFDVDSIVENAVSHTSLFPSLEYNMRIGPPFGRPSQGFEVGARTNASYEDRHRRTPAQNYEGPGSTRKFKCSLCVRHLFER